jgi:hypothetical protein
VVPGEIRFSGLQAMSAIGQKRTWSQGSCG